MEEEESLPVSFSQEQHDICWYIDFSRRSMQHCTSQNWSTVITIITPICARLTAYNVMALAKLIRQTDELWNL